MQGSFAAGSTADAASAEHARYACMIEKRAAVSRGEVLAIDTLAGLRRRGVLFNGIAGVPAIGSSGSVC